MEVSTQNRSSRNTMLTLPIRPAIVLSLLLCLGSLPLKPAVAQGELLKTQISTTPPVQPASSLADPAATIDHLFAQASQEADIITDQAEQIRALATIASSLAQVGQPQAAMKDFERAIALTQKTTPEFNLYDQLTLLEELTVQLAQSGFIDRALRLSQTIPSEFPRAKALNQIAQVLADQGDHKQAREVLWQALRFARGISGIYAYEANGSCGNDKFEVLSSIAGTLSLLDQVSTALTVAQTVHGCSSASGDSGQEYQAWAFLGILAHIQRVEQVQRAWDIAQQTQRSVERPQIWAAIALKLIELNELEQAMLVAQKLETDVFPSFIGYPREIAVKEQAQKSIALALAEKNQFAAAIQVAQAIAEPDPSEVMELQQKGVWAYPIKVRSTTLTQIAHQLALAQQFEQAIELAGTIPDPTLKKLAWIAIAAELQQAGQDTQAQSLFQHANPTIMPQPDDAEGNMAMATVALALVESGQTQPGLQVANTIPYPPYRELALREAAVILTKQGDIETAQALLPSFTEDWSRTIVSQHIVEKQLALGDFQPALAGLSKLDEDTKAHLLIRHATSLSRMGYLDQALQQVDTMTNPRLRINTITALAVALHISEGR